MFPDGSTQTTAVSTSSIPKTQLGTFALSQLGGTWKTWTVTWGTPFPDANYAVNCSVVSGLQSWIGNSGGNVWLDHLYYKLSGSVTVFVVNTTSYSQPFELDCVATEFVANWRPNSGAVVYGAGSGSVQSEGVNPE